MGVKFFFVFFLMILGSYSYEFCFKLSAINLPLSDPLNGDPDPYAVIYYKKNSTDTRVRSGQTQVIYDTPHPNWVDLFCRDYYGGEDQSLQISVYDEDADSNDYQGHVNVTFKSLTDKLFSTETPKEIRLPLKDANRGTVIIKVFSP